MALSEDEKKTGIIILIAVIVLLLVLPVTAPVTGPLIFLSAFRLIYNH